MALNKQIHLYSLDTSCFYTDKEMAIHKKLVKLYSIRKKIKEKQKKLDKSELKKESACNVAGQEGDKRIKSCPTEEGSSTIANKSFLLADAASRTSRLISVYKRQLVNELAAFKGTGKIRELRRERLTPQNITSMFDSVTSRACGIRSNTLTEDIMIVQTYYFEVAEDIVKNGFFYNGEKYTFFTASAGQIRKKKFVVMKESLYCSVKNTLMCGIDEVVINAKGGANRNKFLAYLALNNTATDVWLDFDINRAIVVEDFETLIEAEVDCIDDVSYEIIRKKMKIPVPHMDGCGIMLEKTRMIRLPWMKGLMVKMDFVKLLKKWGHSGDVMDIYGVQHNVFSEDIKYIFTKSQFKMWKYYENWDEYKEKFKKYGCEACYCNMEEDVIPNAKLNYQMLQTLTDIKDNELRTLAAKTIKDIENIGNDYRTMCRILGVGKDSRLYRQRALAIYPELMRHQLTRERLKDVKRKMVGEAKSGKLAISGKYTFVVPDVHAFCEWLFLGERNPRGLLNNGEVHCALFTENEELDCLRSPHLYREHAIRKNVTRPEIREWFVSKGIYTSIHDPISRILQFDCDGDKLLVTNEKVFVRVAKRNMIGIVPLYYEMKKAGCEVINNDSLYEGLDKSYRSGDIGLYSNDITKIWNRERLDDKAIDTIKLLCMENNYSIDEAKTLYMPNRPDVIKKQVKKYTDAKVPYFFVYAKDKQEGSVQPINHSTVNRLSKIIPNKRVRLNKTIGKFETRVLMQDQEFVWLNEYEKIIEKFRQLHKKYVTNRSFKYAENKSEHELWIYQKIRSDMLIDGINIGLCVDILVFYIYDTISFSLDKTLWAAFGDVIYDNIVKNTQDMGEVCPLCGGRFTKGGMVCSGECFKTYRREYKAYWQRENRVCGQ